MAAMRSVAIDTVPLPERPMRYVPDVRLETAILDQIWNRVKDDRADLNTRFKLNIEAIKVIDGPGYVVDPSGPCFSDNPPEWCKYARIDEAHKLVLYSLAANRLLDDGQVEMWTTILQDRSLVEIAPSLLRKIGTEQKRLDDDLIVTMVDRGFQAGSGIAMPIPSSEFDRYCQEHPMDPMCQVARSALKTSLAQRLAGDTVLISLLHQNELINDEQVRLIYDTIFHELTPPRGVADISLVAGVVVTDGYVPDGQTRASIVTSLARAKVSSIDSDRVPEECLKPNPPRWCWFVIAFPVATELTHQLTKAKILQDADVINVWQRLGRNLPILP